MKVWVPIDLPEGYQVRDIILESPWGQPAYTRSIEPLGSTFPDPPAASTPPSEQWEYTSVVQYMFLAVVAEAHGKQGWELIGPMGDGNVWFKRRLRA